MGFLGGSTVKNSPAIAGDAGDLDSILRSGRSPEEGNGDPLHYSCLENAMDSRASWLPSTGSQTAGHTETGHACNTGPQHHVQNPGGMQVSGFFRFGKDSICIYFILCNTPGNTRVASHSQTLIILQ